MVENRTPDADKYDTIGSRLIAGIVDGLILSPLVYIEIALFEFWPSNFVLIPWLIVSYTIPWLYGCLMHGLYGQTVGKMIAKIRVLDVDEGPVSMMQAFLRDIGLIVFNTIGLAVTIYYVGNGESIETTIGNQINLVVSYAALVWFAAEIISALTNQKRRAIHDFIARTVVVRVGKKPESPIRN